MFHLVTATIISVGLAGAGQTEYPRGDLLLEPGQLAKHAGQFRILDARPKDKFLAGHIAGAVWVDHDAWTKGFAAGQAPKEWAARIGSLGIDPDSKVVVYDEAMQKEAARIWWILKYWGVKDVRLLNGGFRAWKEANLETTTKPVAPPARPFPVAAPQTSRLAEKSKVLDIVKKKHVQIIDTRSTAEYCGETKLAKRGGAIPGALHLEWSEALDKKSGRFKPAAELAKLLKEAGIDPSKPAVTYCQSGGRAAVMAFTLELMGAREVANYYRSWAEWGNADDTPVVTPKR